MMMSYRWSQYYYMARYSC